MSGAVYIHTRDRLQFLKQSLPHWMDVLKESNIGLYLVVEPNEARKHERFLVKNNMWVTDILTLPQRNMGMGHSRQVAFDHALDWGHASFITTDDDLVPKDDPGILLETATQDDVFLAGCYFSMYGLLLKIKPHTGLYRIGVGLGFRCFALNTEYLDKLGGFPIEWKGYDDMEIARRGIAQLGMVHHIDSDFVCSSSAKIGDPGGMTSLPGYARVVDRKHTAHLKSKEEWPQFVSNPERCDPDEGKCSFTMYWKRMMEHYGVEV